MPNSAYLIAALLLTACASSTAPRVSPPTTPTTDTTTTSPAQWTLSWSDEFDGPAGTSFDRAKWTADTGGGGWGNQEREYYTTRPENVALDGAGHLVITALAEPPNASDVCWYGRCRYTSARLKTQGLFDQTYGRFEARLQIPRGQGIWPAFWMLGRDIDSAGWPRSGEIDIMENIGKEPFTVHGTVHGPGYSGGNGIGGPYSLTTPVADDFHVFAVEWQPGLIRWLVDDKEYRRTTTADIPAGATWVYDHPFFLLLNVAVGGGWPGDPDATSTYPQRMVVDYVRVYKR